MDPSNVLLMFQQMAVRERHHHDNHAGGGGSDMMMMRQPFCPSSTFRPTCESYSTTALNSNDHYQQQQQQLPPPPLAKQQQQYRSQQQQQQETHHRLAPLRRVQRVVTRSPAITTMKNPKLDNIAEGSETMIRSEEEHQMSLLLASYEEDGCSKRMGEC